MKAVKSLFAALAGSDTGLHRGHQVVQNTGRKG